MDVCRTQHPSNPWSGRGCVGNHPPVPLPLRPTLDERADAGRETSAALSAPERHALTLIAEHAREEARLEHVWILARLPDGGSDGALAWLAHVKKEGAAGVTAAGGPRRPGPRRWGGSPPGGWAAGWVNCTAAPRGWAAS